MLILDFKVPGKTYKWNHAITQKIKHWVGPVQGGERTKYVRWETVWTSGPEQKQIWTCPSDDFVQWEVEQKVEYFKRMVEERRGENSATVKSF